MNAKHVPERMCVACRQMKPKSELIRIVNSDHGVVVDSGGKRNGRGVYICKCVDCIKKAQKNKSFVKNNGFSIDAIINDLEKIIEQES